MSLPEAFTTPSQYFDYCLKFFAKYEFLISHPNTHILINNVLDSIPFEEYLDKVDLHNKEFKLENLRGNSELLDDFFKSIETLHVEYDVVKETEDVAFEAPVCGKKRYEVVRLAEEVGRMCEDHGCDTVVDIGSGLGYLNQRLHLASGLNVLGLESDGGHHARALQRQAQYYADSEGKVVYNRMTVTEDSAADIERCLNEHFHPGPVCLTGLHACADLSVDGVNLFLKMDAVKALVLMPCCYHRMEQKDDGFKNFPLSKVLRELYGQVKSKLGVPFLRIGAHPTHNSSGLGDMVFSLLARAVLQQFAERHNLVMKRSRRKAIKQHTKGNRFQHYLKQLADGYALTPTAGNTQFRSEENASFDHDELWHMWDSLTQPIFKKTAIYTTLQNRLQPAIENFILYDRLVYLKENGVDCTWHKKFFKENQSPRCIALLAVKDGNIG